MSKVTKVAVVDFDGVLAKYDGWRGPDHFGDPVPNAANALQELKTWGWRIVIWTTRRDSERLREWLSAHGITYDAINSCEHNPPGCSTKPIGWVYFDDRSWWDVNRRWDWGRVMRRMRRLFRPPLDTWIDDAACWDGWSVRLWAWLKKLAK